MLSRSPNTSKLWVLVDGVVQRHDGRLAGIGAELGNYRAQCLIEGREGLGRHPNVVRHQMVRLTDAVGVSMNVTIVSPTPNKVDVKLSPNGQVKLYNHNGTVYVLADVGGYYTDKTLKELAATAGVPGPQGPRGFSAWDTIPSGVTVTGSMIWDTDVISNNADHRIYIPFPGKAPVPLTSTLVNFSADATGVTTDDDATCTGTFANPTAPSGKVCLYRRLSVQVDNVNGRADFVNATNGFYVDLRADGAAFDMFLNFGWAYTAP